MGQRAGPTTAFISCCKLVVCVSSLVRAKASCAVHTFGSCLRRRMWMHRSLIVIFLALTLVREEQLMSCSVRIGERKVARLPCRILSALALETDQGESHKLWKHVEDDVPDSTTSTDVTIFTMSRRGLQNCAPCLQVTSSRRVLCHIIFRVAKQRLCHGNENINIHCSVKSCACFFFVLCVLSMCVGRTRFRDFTND